jgi:hypothetical protein
MSVDDTPPDEETILMALEDIRNGYYYELDHAEMAKTLRHPYVRKEGMSEQAALVVQHALRECPELLSKMIRLDSKSQAELLARGVAAELAVYQLCDCGDPGEARGSDLPVNMRMPGHKFVEPTKKQLFEALQTRHPEAMRHVPTSKNGRRDFLERCGLAILPQERTW